MPNDYIDISGREQRMSKDTWTTSRRAFVTYGAASTGMLVGTTGATATGPEPSDSDSDPVDHGLMRSQQFIPSSQATVIESGLDWHPARFDDTYQANVVAYDHAPSYRAFLFTESDATLEPDRSFEFEGVQGAPGTDDRQFVTVGLE